MPVLENSSPVAPKTTMIIAPHLKIDTSEHLEEKGYYTWPNLNRYCTDFLFEILKLVSGSGEGFGQTTMHSLATAAIAFTWAGRYCSVKGGQYIFYDQGGIMGIMRPMGGIISMIPP